MKKLFVLMAAATTVALAGPALADIDEGRITALSQWDISLDRTHQYYTVREPKMLQNLKPGDQVRVEYVFFEGVPELLKIEKVSN